MYVDYKQLGRRLAGRRKELGLKQSEVNEMAGLSDKYLSNIERATSVLSIDVLMKLCTALETTPDYLLLGTVNDNNPTAEEQAFTSKLNRMTPEQKKMTLSLMDWIMKSEQAN